MVKAQVPASRRSAVSRRQALAITLGAAGTATILKRPAVADDPEVHGISAFGDLKYKPDFDHFDYVDPAAPKGGLFSQQVTSRGYNGSFLTFNSLNSYILKGEGAIGMDATFATQMTRAEDEPHALYCLAATPLPLPP